MTTVLICSRGKGRRKRFGTLAEAQMFCAALRRPVHVVTPLGYAESADGIVVTPVDCLITDLFPGVKHAKGT